jgi:hypothetical protein
MEMKRITTKTYINLQAAKNIVLGTVVSSLKIVTHKNNIQDMIIRVQVL